jgi:hypothetical protein
MITDEAALLNDIASHRLFWSERASQAQWVDMEWRCALAARGLDYSSRCAGGSSHHTSTSRTDGKTFQRSEESMKRGSGTGFCPMQTSASQDLRRGHGRSENNFEPQVRFEDFKPVSGSCSWFLV